MPAKVLPTEEQFRLFDQKMLGRGFSRIHPSEWEFDRIRLGLKAPRPQPGREVGYKFDARGLQVRIWTTFLEVEGRARDSDAGWALIVELGTGRYFKQPFHRTKFFLRRLYTWAQILQMHIWHRPVCSEERCRAGMRIMHRKNEEGEETRATFWGCMRKERHATSKPVWKDWDYGLSPKALAFVRADRKKRAWYRARDEAAGKKVGTARQRRKPWTKTHPHNTEIVFH